VVEWGEGTADRLSPDYLVVRMERRDDDVRVLTFEPYGSWRERVGELRSA